MKAPPQILLSTKIFFVGTIISFSIILPINDVTVILLYSKIPMSDHSPGATMPILRPLFFSPDFSPMLSTVKLFYSTTIPLFQFATRPKPHIFPIL